MALKKTTKKEVKKDDSKATTFKSVIISPRMTEKAVLSQEKSGVYVFNVEAGATKRAILLSIKSAYKVTPRAIRTSAIPKKEKFFRGNWGVKGGGKKAYVYLKKGDKISVA